MRLQWIWSIGYIDWLIDWLIYLFIYLFICREETENPKAADMSQRIHMLDNKNKYKTNQQTKLTMNDVAICLSR